MYRQALKAQAQVLLAHQAKAQVAQAKAQAVVVRYHLMITLINLMVAYHYRNGNMIWMHLS